MKIVKAQEMARIEKLAYSQGASEEIFMSKAGIGVAEIVQEVIASHHLQPKITLLCGSGNNAGDAYVAGQLLRAANFQVTALALAPYEESSALCQLQSKRFVDAGGLIVYIKEDTDISFNDSELLVDGLLGTGFHGEVKGLFRRVIELANSSQLPIIAIDIPSGINGTTGEIGNVAIRACDTLFLGLAKTGCFLNEAWDYVGRVHVYNFGLDKEFIEQAQEDFCLIDDPLIMNFLPKVHRTRHKYQAGYVVGVGGSRGMPGAPIMACSAALKSGAGIVRLLHPKGMEVEFTSAPYEIVRQAFKTADEVLETTKKAAAVFFGPGIGHLPAMVRMLKKVLPVLDKPCVIDADALTIITEHDIALPAQTIMTPHHGEFKKMLKISEPISFNELLEKAQNFARNKKIILVLKGSPTFIFLAQGTPFVSARGDPGMATAGSGDILTGIITGFLAQTRDAIKAAVLGVHFHAIAGESAAQRHTSFCMTATDIPKELPHVFKQYI